MLGRFNKREVCGFTGRELFLAHVLPAGFFHCFVFLYSGAGRHSGASQRTEDKSQCERETKYVYTAVSAAHLVYRI